MPDLLTRLADRSLIAVEHSDEEPRYRLLETVREYGAARLAESGETDATHGRHAAVYLDLAEEREPALTGAAQGAALLAIEAEHDNLRAALDWASASGDGETLLRLTGALWQFWAVRGHLSEGRRWLERALAADGPPRRRFKALNGAGNLAYGQGDYDRAAELHDESLAVARTAGEQADEAMALANVGLVAASRGDLDTAVAHHEASLSLARAVDDRRQIAVALNSLGLIAARRGDFARATDLLEASLSLRRELGEQQAIAALLNNLGTIAGRQGKHDRAAALFEESLALRRALGDRQGIAGALTNLGMVAHERGDHARAEALHAESLALARELGDRRGVASALINLGLTASAQEAYPRAVAHYREALVIRHGLADMPGVAACLEGLVAVAQGQGGSARAVRLASAAAALREGASAPLPPADLPRHEATLEAAHSALGNAAFEAAWVAGKNLHGDALVSEALDESGPAATASISPDHRAAE